MKMVQNNYLVSVVKKGVVIALHWSHMLKDIPAIKAMYPGSDVSSADMRQFKEPEKEELPPERNLTCRPYRNRVRCVETGEIYDSVFACSIATGVSTKAIYKGMRNGFGAGGYHFEYLPKKKEGK